jgi:PAS domain S-box-containing protein
VEAEKKMTSQAIETDLQSLLHNATDFAVYRLAVEPSHPFGAQVVMVSPSLTDIAGITELKRFETWFENLHPDDRERVAAANKRAVEMGERYDQVTRVYHPAKKRWVWVRTLSKPIFDAQGTLTHFNGLVIDVSEQKRAQEALQHRSDFENLVTAISTRFINLGFDQIDGGIIQALREIGEFTAADRSYVFRFHEDGIRFSCSHEWNAPGIAPQNDDRQDLAVEDWRWSNASILKNRVLHVPRVADLPAEAATEQREFERHGIQSLIAVPMAYQGDVLGFLGFDAVRAEKTWVEQDIALLKIVGEIFINALAHKRDQLLLQNAYQSLEQRVQERTRELSTLLQVGQNVISTLERDQLLGVILDRLGTVIPYSGASIFSLQDDALRVIAYRGPLDPTQALQIRFDLSGVVINRQVIEQRRPVIVSDTRGDTARARLFRQSAGDELHTTFAYIRSWIGLPLIVQDRVIGMLTLDHNEPNAYTDRQVQLAMAFAHEAAIAIENARLYHAEQERLQESERRRQIAESLRDIVAAINASLPLQNILERIVAQAATHLGAAACVMSRFDMDREQFSHEATYGWPAELAQRKVISFALQWQTGSADYLRTVLERKPTYNNYGPLPDRLDEIRNDPSISPEIKARRLIIRSHFAGSMGVPLVVNNQAYGGLLFYYAQPQAFSEEQIQLALTFAEQAALAIENAQLRQQVAQSAVAVERSRLARDLHDAVTQTLFSASLIAEVLPRIWERNPQEGKRRLAELRELTRGALAEMRTLLLELRPSALVEAQLSDLLRQLGESITGRARVPVSVTVKGDCQVPVEVKVALYRIAQEAVNNVAKHAQASQATVYLNCDPDRVELAVRDNGCGFDLTDTPPDHLGLGIMRERAEDVGATLEIESQAGSGTQVRVSWENPNLEKDSQ